YDIIDQYNSNLKTPLNNREVLNLIKSAYSGKYQGASKAYINSFYDLYCDGNTMKKYSKSRYWYKHKKAREDRQRVHFEEWEIDLIRFIEDTQRESEDDKDIFITSTQAKICESINIPSSTLNVVLKKTTKIIKRVLGKGRNAKTEWTTLALLIKRALKLKQKEGEVYRVYIKYLQGLLIKGKTLKNGAYHICVRLLDLLSAESIDRHEIILNKAMVEIKRDTG
ncbi:hypothetical protein ACOMCU_27570, partial [Lysinibacillus sp. UGB7]